MLRIFADSGRVEVWFGKGKGNCPIASMTIDNVEDARAIASELGKSINVELISDGKVVQFFNPGEEEDG